MSNRTFYSASFRQFLSDSIDSIVGQLSQHITQNLTHQATSAWHFQIKLLQEILQTFGDGHIFFEFLIPRMGRRVDVVLIIGGVIFVLEFKVGAQHYYKQDIRQAEGYALDLANFHEPSHGQRICPLLVATHAPDVVHQLSQNPDNSMNVMMPICTNSQSLLPCLKMVMAKYQDLPFIDTQIWKTGRYKATPTIIEAAQSLYANHDVEDIARADAEAINIAETSAKIEEIIRHSRRNHQKSICFVTGVPGAGKTLVGLNIASKHQDANSENAAIFLSGNGPLVTILKEALARDEAARNKRSIDHARREMDSVIQNVHRFRDHYLDDNGPPTNKIVIFDEAQRAWNAAKTIKFMQQKRNQFDFDQSEPDFLIGVMDRHQDWCVVIALVGGGQEINDGEAGLNGWFQAFQDQYPHWNVYYSDKLSQVEYVGNDAAFHFKDRIHAYSEKSLHLSISMRSFRAEKVSHFIHYLVQNQPEKANVIYQTIGHAYPIKITRNLAAARAWVRSKQRGQETIGLVAASGAKRLRADGIAISNDIDPVHWFLNGQDDVRSSHYLEEAGSEFLVQGLEMDWVLMAWDADFRFKDGQFEYWQFKGTKWQSIKKHSDQNYLMNSYRVLLTRARQGMVIYVPMGNDDDPTRPKRFFNDTYEYLISCGIQSI